MINKSRLKRKSAARNNFLGCILEEAHRGAREQYEKTRSLPDEKRSITSPVPRLPQLPSLADLHKARSDLEARNRASVAASHPHHSYQYKTRGYRREPYQRHAHSVIRGAPMYRPHDIESHDAIVRYTRSLPEHYTPSNTYSSKLNRAQRGKLNIMDQVSRGCTKIKHEPERPQEFQLSLPYTNQEGNRSYIKFCVHKYLYMRWDINDPINHSGSWKPYIRYYWDSVDAKVQHKSCSQAPLYGRNGLSRQLAHRMREQYYEKVTGRSKGVRKDELQSSPARNLEIRYLVREVNTVLMHLFRREHEDVVERRDTEYSQRIVKEAKDRKKIRKMRRDLDQRGQDHPRNGLDRPPRD